MDCQSELLQEDHFETIRSCSCDTCKSDTTSENDQQAAVARDSVL